MPLTKISPSPASPLLANPDYQRWLRGLHDSLATTPLSRDQLAVQLDISVRTLRRVLNGATPPSLTTYLALNERYGLEPIGCAAQVRLTAPAPGTDRTHFDPLTYTAALTAAAAGIGESGRLDVLTVDLPVFYFLANPLLAEWKLRFFMIEPKVGAPERLDESLAGAQGLAHQYASLPRREVWGADPLRGFCHQLERLAAGGRISPDATRSCFDLLEELLRELSVQLLDGTSGLRLRIQTAFAGAARYIVHFGDGTCRAHVSLDSPGFLAGASPSTCAYFAQQFEESWRHAEIVSEDPQAIQVYFAQQRSALERRRERVLARLP